ncbi:MAG TPA: hypothetical protein VGF76_13375 [Polyangiaceae bacterium]
MGGVRAPLVQRVETPGASAVYGEEGAHQEQHERILVAAVLGEQAVPNMNGEDGDQHGAQRPERRDTRQQAQEKPEPA